MNNLLVTKMSDVKAGLERLGLIVTVQDTKVEEWKRLIVHAPYKKDCTQYIMRISFHYGILNSYKVFGLPGFWFSAVRLLLEKHIIMDYIKYLVLGTQAANETLHLKEQIKRARNKKEENSMTRFYLEEKHRRFQSLINHHYYGLPLREVQNAP